MSYLQTSDDRRALRSLLPLLLILAIACGGPGPAEGPDAGNTNSPDASIDAGSRADDAGVSDPDAGSNDGDAGTGDVDAGEEPVDAGQGGLDAGDTEPDAGADEPDAGTEAPDAGTEGIDAGAEDPDAGPEEPDAGVPGCDPVPVWYLDPDGDGYGDADDTLESCTQPPGYAPLIETAIRLELAPTTLEVPVGTGDRLTATLVYNSGRTDDVTAFATWSSSAPDVIRVGSGAQGGGIVDALTLGQAVVRAVYESLEAAVTVEAGAPIVRSLRVTPAEATVVIGDGRGAFYTAHATYTDGAVVDVTEDAQWSTPSSQLGRIGNVSSAEWRESELNGTPIDYFGKGHFLSIGLNYSVDPPVEWVSGTGTVVATFGGLVATATVVVTEAALTSVGIDSVAPILLGSSVPLVARGFTSNGLNRDVSRDAQWSSSHPSVIQVSADAQGNPVATALAPGEATLTACVGTTCGTLRVEVNARVLTGLRVLTDSPNVLIGQTTRMKAIAVYADGLQQDVTSLFPVTQWRFEGSAQVATAFDGTPGLAVYEGGFRHAYTVLGVQPGILDLTVSLATSPTTAVSTNVIFEVRAPQLVSLAVTPPTLSLPFADTARLRAMGTFEDGSIRDVSDQAIWLADDPAIALPNGTDSTGAVIDGLAGGQTRVVARAGAHSASATVEVLDAIQSIALVPVVPETLAPYAPPFRSESFVRFLVRATLASGATRDLPADGFRWEVPWSFANGGAYVALAAVGPGLFRVRQALAATVVASRVLDNGTTISGSYLVNSALDLPNDLVVDPPNPAAAWDGLSSVTRQFFKVYVRYQSGRRVDVTDAALSVRVTPRADVDYGDNPGTVAAPGEVVESTYWELVDLAPGFANDRVRYPEIGAIRDTAQTTAVRRFDAPRNLAGRFDVQFQYAGLSTTVAMALRPSTWTINLDPGFTLTPSLYETSANTAPQRLVVQGMGDLLIKDIDPTYTAALRMMEGRAVTRATTLTAAAVEAAFRASPETAAMSPTDLQTLVDQMNTALASQRVREQTALIIEFQLLLAKPKATRSAQENLVVTWLGKTVRDARIASAEAVLREYTEWADDPWAYVPPPGITYVTPPPQANMVSLFDMPAPPDLLKIARAGISPALVTGTETAVMQTLATASVTGASLVTGALISSGVAALGKAILPYAVIAAEKAGSVASLGATTVGAPAIIITAVIVIAIQSVQIIEREALPRRLAEIVTATKAEPAPDPDAMLQRADGLQALVGALLTRMY